jgi:hypothetical protein
VDINISEKHAASIFSVEVAYFFKMLVATVLCVTIHKTIAALKTIKLV